MSSSAVTHGQRSRWLTPDLPEGEIATLARRCGLELPATRVLWNRGLRDQHAIERFLNPRLTDMYDPFLLSGMERAVERIRRAIRDREKVLIYGDYDTDGLCSVVILRRMLEILGVEAGFHVPDRLKEGYGMQPDVVRRAAASGVKLLISVDTGIRSVEAVQVANEVGVDVIITDHHLAKTDLPPALAILNPNQPGCPYPNKNLCGAGVTFKLIQALMYRLEWVPNQIVRYSDSFLMMVAIATVADVVPLTGENRVIVKRGLEGLPGARNKGLRALMETAGFVQGEALSAGDVGFRISPRINAAGRMRNARDVVELFLTDDEERARKIAAELSELNNERRVTEESIVREVIESCRERPVGSEDYGLVFSGSGWHRGVVGIVASRLVEEYHRPVLVLAEDGETGLAQGSGRSIDRFHLLEALESMAELFVRFGGHKHAVGLTLEAARVAELRERFNAYARTRLAPEDLVPMRRVDARMALSEVSTKAVEEVLRLAPFGLGNPAPQFLFSNVPVYEAPVVFKDRHLRLRIGGQGHNSLFLKAWNFASRIEEITPGTLIDALVCFETDTYAASRGYPGWSANLRDFNTAGGACGQPRTGHEPY